MSCLQEITFKPWQLAILSAVFITWVDDSSTLSSLMRTLDFSTLSDIGFFALVFGLIVLTVATLTLLIGVGRFLKPSIVILLISSALLGYFVNDLGIVFSDEMFVNIADTIRERNTQEAFELISWNLVRQVCLYGVVPSLLLIFIRVASSPPWTELRERLVILISGAGIVLALFLLDYRFASFFAVENRDLRYGLVPLYPLAEATEALKDAFDEGSEFKVLGDDAVISRHFPRRTVGVMVIGETARADHFSLNGYERLTNPALQEIDDLVFIEAEACGTSTAYSVPCMFFLRGHENYSPRVAASESNVLDVLESAGVKTVWIENNSSCKGVCARTLEIDLRAGMANSVNGAGQYDEAMLDVLKQVLTQNQGDMLIVLHMMGSHGPAYSRRYPQRFAVFQHPCEKVSPQQCDHQEVINAYDNSLVYTDYVLSRIIGLLDTDSRACDSFVLYASDHGESLGEKGVYLHGIPKSLAPEAQYQVPILVWLSSDFQADHGTHIAAVKSGEFVSHDVIPHTLLGLFGVSTRVYSSKEDILGT